MAQDTDNRREDQIYDINSTHVTGGLQTDVSEVNQPQGTQRYVLNGIKETMNKDINTLSNDYSNVQLDTTKVPLNTTQNEKDYLLGSIYLNNDEFVLFILTYVTVSNTLIQVSKLCLFNSVTNVMTFLISDEDSPEENKLHFNEHHQIQGIYRLRRGCDRTIYFADNFNAPRTINIDKLYNYYDTTNTTAIAVKFNLIRTYNKIPEFKKIIGKDGNDEPIYESGVEIKEGGKLPAGGYNLTIRLLDDDLNPTDWITTTNVVIVSNFGPNEYTKMRGSTNKVTDWQNFGDTDKLIEVSVTSESIDTNFSYLQFGLIYANSGDGTVGGVHVSPMIGIEEKNAPDNYTYQFTGAVEYDKDTVESVTFGPTNIGKAKTITSIQNRLLLGNVESKQVDWCKLQKYASQIAVCAEKKTIQLKDIKDKENLANAVHNLESTGYMPGEIYSFGIVYVFDDGTTSPAYHIPGIKIEPTNENPIPGFVDKDGTGDYITMNVTDNECENATYLDRSGCEGVDYWGKDIFGNDLKGEKVRHHRFPTRSWANIPLYESTHDYNCHLKECDASDKYTECQDDYYIELPYHKVTNHYKMNHSSFTIDIYLAINNPTDGAYPSITTPDPYWSMNNRYDIECVTKTINIDDWDASQKGYNGKTRYYRIDLGTYNYPPKLVGISEEPVKYIRSNGDKGTRYGWETTAGWQKIRYKTQDDSWEEDPTYTGSDMGFPLDEDGSFLNAYFYNINTNAGQYKDLKGKYNRQDAEFQFYGNPYIILNQYLQDNNKEFYNVSVVNIKKLNDKSQPSRNIRAKRDINIEGCEKQYGEYSVTILGAHFWNIKMPDLKDTNNNKIIGYYIVRNKRDEDNKTILDSAVTIPLGNRKENGSNYSKYIAYGFTDMNKGNDHENVSREAIGFICPEFKYLKKKYKSFEFVVQGVFEAIDTKNITNNKLCDKSDDKSIVSTCSYLNESVTSFDTSMVIEDVQPGTSYNKKEAKKTEYDNNGYELYSLVRERIYTYKNGQELYCKPSKVKYLDALDDTIMDSQRGMLCIHNLSSDNAIGIMELDGVDSYIKFGNGTDIDTNTKNYFFSNLLYGHFKVNVPNPYGNFRLLPYYKESKNIEVLDYDENSITSTTTFSGDVYTTPMKYWNSVYYNTRLRLRDRKSGLARIIVGAFATVASLVGTVFASIYTGGAALQAGLATVKASFSLMMSGIKMAKANTLYAKLYFKGLQSTLEDKWTKFWLKKPNPLDDQIQWTFDVTNSLWFESTVNQFWRVGTSGDLPDFLEPLKIYDTQDYVTYITNKMTIADSNQNNGRVYQGFASAEYYEVNPDYTRGNIQKAFYHLPIQYDCCSKCLERYPHRIVYSEVSFQEELTDNYTKFLALNYRDIPGETGEITNLFQQDTFLYIQTEEGLWNMPVGTQEIKTQGLTTYLGNGAFFSNEPQKISDTGLGSRYQHGTLITRYGIFFIDDQYGKVYVLQKGKTAYGKSTIGSPTSLIDLGMTYWGKDNVKSYADEYYKRMHDGLHYPHLDNTASEGGMGYLTTYDERNERFILTKKDRIVKPYYLDDNDNKVYPKWIEFNGTYYDTENLVEPDRGTRTSVPWSFIEIKDNKAVWGRFECDATYSHVQVIDPYDPGTYTITNKSIRFLFVDELGNELDATQIQEFGLTLGTISIDFEINGTPYSSEQFTLQQGVEQIFDSSRQDANSIITITNIQDILDDVFANATQDNLGYTTYMTVTVNSSKSCDSETLVEVVVKTSSSVQCSLTVEKVFMFNEEEEIPDIETLAALFADSPSINIDSVNIEISLEGYSDEGNTKKFIFGTVEVPCEGGGIDWGSVSPDNPNTHINEDGLFTDPATVFQTYELSEWTISGNNRKILTLINTTIQPDVPDVPVEDLSKSVKSLRGVTPPSVPICKDPSEYDDHNEETKVTFKCPYVIVEQELETLTVDDTDIEDYSWTLSFNMKAQCWESFHSYVPNMYICAKDTFYSYRIDKEGLWQHNIDGSFGVYYGDPYQFIVDFVSVNENGIATKVWNDLYVIADVQRYDSTLKEYYDINNVFFDKAIIWNHRQCSKELELSLKENQMDENYLLYQVDDTDLTKINVDRNERNWAFNGFRDNVDHSRTQPIWLKKYDNSVKELNPAVFFTGNNVQSWYETEIFRGKFLEVMLKFTNFAPEIIIPSEDEEEDDVIIPEVDNTDVKIILYFTIEGRNKTVR